MKIDFCAFVLYRNELFNKVVNCNFHARPQRNGQAEVFFGRAETVYAGNGSNDYNVSSFGERASRGMAHLVYLIVYGKVLFYVGVGRGNIRLGLIIIVIGNEIFHPVFGEIFLQLAAKLRRKRLVVRDNERRAVDFFDNVCHRKGLAAARYADKDLRAETV